MGRRLGAVGSVLLLLLASSTALPVAAQTAPTDPVSVLQQFFTSVNRNDPPATQAAFFTDDVIFIGGPCDEQPMGMCVGKAQLIQAFAPGEGIEQLSLMQPPTVTGEAGNVLQFRFAVGLSGAPELAQAGIQRFVQVGQVVFSNGKVSRAAMTFDVTDPQTVAFLRLGASFGPPPASLVPVAEDGQSLATQPAGTQIQFLTVWGDPAAAEWVKQHNAALSSGGGR